MATPVIMPKAGMAMETGTVVQWLKSEGDTVTTGEPILEIETDKVLMEVEAETSGVLLKIICHEGDEVPVTQTIAYIGEEGEPIPDGLEPESASADSSTPAPDDAATEPSASSAAASAPRPPSGAAPTANSRGAVRATPAARRIASEEGIRLRDVAPTGAAGEVTAADVRRAADAVTAGRKLPLSTMRRAIVRAMTASAAVPQFTVHVDVDARALLAFRSREESVSGTRPSITTLVVRAMARVLTNRPEFARVLAGDALVEPDVVGIGLAVSVPDGIVVPVFSGAADGSLAELDRRMKDRAAAARNGSLGAEDLSGAVTTVSNLGSSRVTSFTPMITPPQSSVLGVAALRSEAVVRDGALDERPVLGLNLTVDHRVIDGAPAAAFVGEIAATLETPELLE